MSIRYLAYLVNISVLPLGSGPRACKAQERPQHNRKNNRHVVSMKMRPKNFARSNCHFQLVRPSMLNQYHTFQVGYNANHSMQRATIRIRFLMYHHRDSHHRWWLSQHVVAMTQEQALAQMKRNRSNRKMILCPPQNQYRWSNENELNEEQEYP